MESPPPQMETPAKKSSSAAPKIILTLGVTIILIIITFTASMYVILVQIPPKMVRQTANETVGAAERGYSLAKKIADDFSRVFQFTPQIAVGDRIVHQSSSSVLELVTVTRPSTVRSKWEHKWLGSKKVMEMEAVANVRVGFDLREPFQVRIDNGGERVVVNLPQPRIFSVDIGDFKVIKDENGWWNKIKAEDREAALNDLRAKAKEQAIQADLLKEAQQNALTRIEELVRKNGAKVTFALDEGKAN